MIEIHDISKKRSLLSDCVFYDVITDYFSVYNSTCLPRWASLIRIT